MKLTATKYVNARLGKASTNAPNPYFLSPGEIIEITDVVIGDSIEANSIWYLDSNGSYFWSGGFSHNPFDSESFAFQKEFSGIDKEQQLSLLDSLISAFVAEYDSPAIKAVGAVEVKQSLGIIISVTAACLNKYQTTFEGAIFYDGFRVPVNVIPEEKVSCNVKVVTDDIGPLPMGKSLQNLTSKTIGTRGLKLEMNASVVILTCYHVACYNLMVRRIMTFDQSNIEISMPAHSTPPSGVTPLKYKVIKGQIGGYFDFALVEIKKYASISSNIASIGFPKGFYTAQDINSLIPGKILKTHGCISGKRSGKIIKPSISTSFVTIDYPGIGSTKIYGVIETEKICTEGDSGAPVTDDQNKVVGIVIASNSTASIVMPFYKLLNIHPLNLYQS